MKWHVIRLCETNRRGEAYTGRKGVGVSMYEVGKTKETPNAKGLALKANKNFADCAST